MIIDGVDVGFGWVSAFQLRGTMWVGSEMRAWRLSSAVCLVFSPLLGCENYVFFLTCAACSQEFDPVGGDAGGEERQGYERIHHDIVSYDEVGPLSARKIVRKTCPGAIFLTIIISFAGV